jgi:hypothetical protein
MSAVVIAAPCSADRTTWTARADIRRPAATLPASGTRSCVPDGTGTASARIAAATGYASRTELMEAL